jgi:hypothetical protein
MLAPLDPAERAALLALLDKLIDGAPAWADGEGRTDGARSGR